MCALLNAWEFAEGGAVPKDHEDLLVFLNTNGLVVQFENIVTLLKISLTLPVSSAYDERAFSCLKRIKTYLQSTMTEKRTSDRFVISISKEVLKEVRQRLTKTDISLVHGNTTQR